MTLDDALDKIDGLESDIHAIVEAIAARSAHRRGDMDSLFEFVAANYPKLWERFNGNPRYPFTNGETALDALAQAARPEPAFLSEAEMREQAARCSCGGADEYCPCQNTPDITTLQKRELATVEAKNND